MTDTTPQGGSHAPFAALEIPFSSIPPPDTPAYAEFLAHYISSAFSFIRGAPQWRKTKAFNTTVGGAVQCKVLPSQVPQIGKRGWHLRESQHGPDCGLTYHDFRRYIRFQHSENEQKYIDDIVITECVAKVKPDEAEIWHNAYKLPIVTADRDFVQMLLTIDLPPHPEPYSEAHEAVTLSWIRDPSRTLAPPSASHDPSYRSFLVLQFPVKHPDFPENPPKVRAVYSSFEAIYESAPPASGEEGSPARKVVNWKMSCQSDTRGRIPSMMQEMAMPGEIAHDVHAFIAWAKKQKAENPPLSNEQTPCDTA